MYTIIKTSELPLAVRAAVQSVYNFREVKVQVGTEFTVGTSWHDCNRTDVTVLDLANDKTQTVQGGYYNSYVNMSRDERALYHGVKVPITTPDIWILEFNTYPKSVTVYCHPDCIAKLLPAELPLTRNQQIVLYITRSLISSARAEEARRFKIGKQELETIKSQLQILGLMTKAGSLTIAGKNEAMKHNFNYWEV